MGYMVHKSRRETLLRQGFHGPGTLSSRHEHLVTAGRQRCLALGLISAHVGMSRPTARWDWGGQHEAVA